MQHSNDFPPVRTTKLTKPIPLTVLVVDNYEDSAELLKAVFEYEGHSVATSPDSATALELAKTETFDAIYIDIKMGEANGYDLAASLREMPAYADTAFVALSAFDHSTPEQLAQLRDFDYFLLKPTGIQQILQPLIGIAPKG